MGVVVTKEKDTNAELTNRINADLREKFAKSEALEGEENDYLLEDSEYLENFQKTNRFAWVWIILIALAIASLIFIILF